MCKKLEEKLHMLSKDMEEVNSRLPETEPIGEMWDENCAG